MALVASKSVVPYLRFFVDMIAASYLFDSFLPNIQFKCYLKEQSMHILSDLNLGEFLVCFG
jgi:hypothetical protein